MSNVRSPLLDDEEPPPSYQSVMRVQAQTQVIDEIEQDEPPPDMSQRPITNHLTQSSVLCACLFTTQLIGAGLLCIPYAIVCTGWTGLIVVFIVGVLMILSSVHLAQCWDMCIAINPNIRHDVYANPYVIIAQQAFGTPGRVAVATLQGLVHLCVLCTYLLISGYILHKLFYGIFLQTSICNWIFILGCIITPCTFYGSPTRYWSSLSYGMTLILMVSYSTAMIDILFNISHEDPTQHPDITPKSYLEGVGIVVFSFGGPHVIPGRLFDTLYVKKPAFNINMFFILVVYIMLAGQIYLFKEKDIGPSVMFDVESFTGTFTKSLILTYLFYVSLNTVDLLCRPIEETINSQFPYSRIKIIVRIMMMLMAIFLSMVVDNFIVIMITVGLTIIPLLSLCVPQMCYIALSRIPNNSDTCLLRYYFKLFLRLLQAVISMMIVLAATYFVISEILIKVKYGENCF